LAIVKMYAPFVPFVTEEIYQQLFAANGEDSVHATSLPVVEDWLEQIKSADSFGLVLEIVKQVRKYRSDKAMSFKAEIDLVRVETKETSIDLDFIAQTMNVKRVELGSGDAQPFWTDPANKVWIL